MSDWAKVVAATEGHNLDKISVHFDEDRSWTYAYCTCGNEPDREAFKEPWEFTDHIRRIVFNALQTTDMASPMASPDAEKASNG
jgi:hypothetical protein